MDSLKRVFPKMMMDLLERLPHISPKIEALLEKEINELPKVTYYFPEQIFMYSPIASRWFRKLKEHRYHVDTLRYSKDTFLPELSNAVVVGRLDLRFLDGKHVGDSNLFFRKVLNTDFTVEEKIEELLLEMETYPVPIEYKLHIFLPAMMRISDGFATLNINASGIEREIASIFEMDIRLYEQNLRICEDAVRHIRGSQSRPIDELSQDLYEAELWLRHSLSGMDYPAKIMTTFSEKFIKEHIPNAKLKPVYFNKKETFNLDTVKYKSKVLHHMNYDWHSYGSDFTDPGDIILISDMDLNKMLCTYFDIDGIHKATAEHIPEGVLAMYLREHHADIPIQPIYTENGMRYIIHRDGKELLAFVIPGETCLYAVGYDQDANTPIMMQFDGQRGMRYQFKY